LCEIPLLPGAAFRALGAHCRSDAKERTKALMTLLAIIERRPSCRWQALQLLIELSYSNLEKEGDDKIRVDSIRLLINKIYNPGSQFPMRWQLPQLSDAEAAPKLGTPAEQAAAVAAAKAPNDFVSYAQLRGRCIEDIATLLLHSMAPSTAQFAFPVQVSPRVEQLQVSLFRDPLKVAQPKDRVWLYLALCIKRPVLLHSLVETFTKCDEEMQDHLVNSIEEAVKHIKPSEPELLLLVEKASPQTERLVLKVLHILVQTSQGQGGEGLPAAYGTAVTRLYGLTKNQKLLVPVFDLLERRQVLDFLPEMLKLEDKMISEAFELLVRCKSPKLSVTELLTELHYMNKPGEQDIVPIKRSMQALNILFEMRDKFDQKIYGIVIQSLVEERGALPKLFMRTVIQLVKNVPNLSEFIIKEIMPRLARDDIFRDDNMWKGFMLVLQHTYTSQPGNVARVLTMLPSSKLEDVLVNHPDWKPQLREFVNRQPLGSVAAHVRQLLQ
jgi:hypothetical protein